MATKKCPKCGIEKDVALFARHSQAKSGICYCKKCNVAASIEANEKLKALTIAAYGGQCEHCGIADLDVLTVDHIDQQGAAHRKANGLTAGNKTWSWLKRQNFPKGFRVLCFNCNTKAYRNFLRLLREQQL